MKIVGVTVKLVGVAGAAASKPLERVRNMPAKNAPSAKDKPKCSVSPAMPKTISKRLKNRTRKQQFKRKNRTKIKKIKNQQKSKLKFYQN